MSKGPKKKSAWSKVRSKTGARKAAKGRAQSTAQTAAKVKTAPQSPPKSPPKSLADQELPSQADGGAGSTSAGPRKKTGGGNAAISLIFFLSVLGTGAYINWMFWSETVVPAKIGTQTDEAMPGPTPEPEPGPKPASKEIVLSDVQKEAPKDIPKAAPKESPGDLAEDSVEKMTADRWQLRQALDRLIARMESIEKSLNQVKKIAQATTSPTEKFRSSTALEGNPKRLSSVEESDDKIKRLMQRMDKMEKDYIAKGAADFIVPANGAGAGPGIDAGPSAGALVLAVENLRHALATDEPFDKALHAFNALAGDSPEISATVTLLAKNASKGLPTRAALAGRFDAIAGKIVQASREVEEKNWLDRAVNRMSKLVSWRWIDGQDGEHPIDAMVVSAEAHLKGGDLNSAIKAVEGLSVNAKAAAVAASWLADAKARLVADRALAGLNQQALSLLTPAPLTPAGPKKGGRR